MPGEGMGKDVALPHQRHHLADHRVGVHVRPLGGPELAEMDVDRELRLAGDLARPFEHLAAPARGAADLGVRLDALDDVAVGHGDPGGALHVDLLGPVERGVAMPLQPAHRVGGKEAEHPGLRGLDDELAEAGERHQARPALVDHRGDARPHPAEIGVEPELPGDVAVDMGVGVDQAGQHEAAAHVDHPFRPLDPRLDRGDAPARDPDIGLAVAPGRGVDHPPAPEDQVVASGPARHSRLPFSAARSGFPRTRRPASGIPARYPCRAA